MDAQRLTLSQVVVALERLYGTPPAVITDVFELIVWENVAYLVDDKRRLEVFERLRREVGTEPQAILNCPLTRLAQVIEAGGMQPERRAEKLHDSAKLALEIGLESLNLLIGRDPGKAKKSLRRFPGIGEPGADKILLFKRAERTLAPDSNAVRVLVRLGFGEEDANYSRMYHSVITATHPLLPHDFDWLIRAHQLLRLHGQNLCKRSTPRCELCPLNGSCRWFLAHKPADP